MCAREEVPVKGRRAMGPAREAKVFDKPPRRRPDKSSIVIHKDRYLKFIHLIDWGSGFKFVFLFNFGLLIYN